jgi:uncharacterized protein (DUF885 family)
VSQRTEPAWTLSERYWDRLLALNPLLGTVTGDERFDDRLPDLTEAGREESASLHRSTLAELEGIDRDSLDGSLRPTMDILEAVARRALEEVDQRLDRLQVASHLWGPAQLIGEIASLQRVDSPERLDRYLGRLAAFPDYLDGAADVAADGIASGVTSPRVVAERAVGQVERILALGADGSPAIAPTSDPRDKDRVVEMVRETVNPAYERFLAVLRDYLPHATETIGVSALPGGDAIYAAQIVSWTTLALDARDVHEMGLERFESIGEERREVAAALGFGSPEEAVAAHTAAGDNTAASPEALVKLAEEQVERSWEMAPTYFGRMPKATCEVRAVEPFREADMPFAFYNPPTEDGSRPGVYYVNTYDIASRALHHLAATTYHEANPGHHFQLTIEQEIPDRPRLRRFGGFLAGSAFCEGWGLYSERLADEMGLYADEWERLGMLEGQAHRAARLITDTGIHALGWSRDSAIATLEEAGLPHVDAAIEIDRYITLPGQALSYMIGMVEIERARAAASARGGSSFSLRDFHDRLLGLGQLPLAALQRELG